MATTTNYNWTTPDDTALVKDGAAAIRSLGTAIDTTVFNNAGASIAKTIVDAKGDIIAATAADTVARLAVGTDGQVLKANSSTATGLEWATDASGMTNPMTTTGDTIYSSSGSTPARLGIGTAGQVLQVNSGATAPEWATPAGSAQNYTIINSGGTSLSGSTTTISGISGKNSLLIQIDSASSNAADESYYLRINTDSSTLYYEVGLQMTNAFAMNKITQLQDKYHLATSGSSASDGMNRCIVVIDGANGTGLKPIRSSATATGSGAGVANIMANGIYSGSSTISSISILTVAGSFDAGTVYVYGA